MDLDEDLIGSGAGKGPTRVRNKFVPKPAKPRPPKPELPEPKPEPRDPVAVAKTEKFEDVAKPEPSNGAVKMEVEAAKPEEERVAKSEEEPAAVALNEGDRMEVDAEVKEAEVEGEEEEDVVVRSIEVFNVPSVDPETQLYLMQYPLRPYWRPYELDDRCQEVRMKPGTNDMEIDLRLHDSSNWDAAKARKNNVEKQVLCSSWERRPAVNAISVAVLEGNQLYLNHVHSVLQFRPSLERLNPVGEKRKTNLSSEGEVNIKVENSAERKPSASKKQNKQVESDNGLVSVKESWVRLQYHGSKSDFSALYLKKMVNRENDPIIFTMSPHEYMRSLCPLPSENMKSKGPSRRALLSLPLEERIKKLLLEGAKRFSLFKRFASEDNIEELLTVLQEFGRLVQGLWVPRTNMIQFSSPEQRRFGPLARDYVLLMFSKDLVVSSLKFDVSDAKLREQVKLFRSLFAVERPSSRDWKFKENRDDSFIEHYPEIVEKQRAIWKKLEDKIINLPNLAIKNACVVQNNMPRPPVASNPVNPSNTNQHTEKGSQRGSSKRMITVETREALLKALPKVLQTHKVCSFEFICESLRDLAVSRSTLPKADPRIAVAAASAADAPPGELQEVISEVATNIHGFYVLKSSPDHPEYDHLRKVVIDLLLARGPNAKVKKAEVLEAARLALKREVSNAEYNKVMTDFCVSRGSAWILKSGDGKP